MADGGYENPTYDPDTIDDHDNDDDDKQGHDETTPFLPGSASTPGPDGEEIPMQQCIMKRADCQTKPTMKSLR